MKEISRAELSQHCTKDDAWIAVDGQVYDITKYAPNHPGGSLILLGAGTDATILFHTCHTRLPSLKRVGMQHIGTYAEKPILSDFFHTCKDRVRKALAKTEKRPWSALRNMWGWMLCAAISWIQVVFYHNLLFVPLFMSSQIRIGGWCHMLSHNNVFRKPKWNNLHIYLIRILGFFEPGYSFFRGESNASIATSLAMKTLSKSFGQHQAVHHIYTNDTAVDLDIYAFTGGTLQKEHVYVKPKSFLPLSLIQGVKQPSIAFLLLPAFSVLGGFHAMWQMLSSLLFVFQPRLLLMSQVTAIDRITALMTACTHMMFWYSLYQAGLVLPAFLCTVGLCHMIEFPTVLFAQHYMDTTLVKRPENEAWDLTQIHTTVNFEPNWLNALGGFECTSQYHLEHHLFPSISPHNLHLVAPIVQEACKEFNLPYKTFDSKSLRAAFFQTFDKKITLEGIVKCLNHGGLYFPEY